MRPKDIMSFRLSGYGKDVDIHYIWRKKKRDMEHAYSRMIGEEVEDVDTKAFGYMMKVRGQNTFYVALSGTGWSLFDTIVHEACHIGQCVSRNREVSAEMTARVSSEMIKRLLQDKVGGLHCK